MTDTEMTKLCAEAMGLDYDAHEEGVSVLTKWGSFPYDPLRDDKQAMDLIRKLKLCVTSTGTMFAASTTPEAPYSRSYNYDLRRAIVECVAKCKQRAVESGKPAFA